MAAALSADGSAASLCVDGLNQHISGAQYSEKWGLADFVSKMMGVIATDEPDDPFVFMMQYIAANRPTPPAPRIESSDGCHRVNTTACLRKPVNQLLDLTIQDLGWEAEVDTSKDDQESTIFFVWGDQALLERIPVLPPGSRISRFPGMSNLCDKVNMAIALRFLENLWPEAFPFWPKCWIIPDDHSHLVSWMDDRKEAGEDSNVIVKPGGGSLGEGIFITQDWMDFNVKIEVRNPGFSALAQVYVPRPLLLNGFKFDLRVYVVLTSLSPLKAYLCTEGLARFCTAEYEAPTAANLGNAMAHLTNYSLNKASDNFQHTEEPFDMNSTASKRPLSTLLRQLEMQQAAEGKIFDEEKFFQQLEEVSAVLLMALAPVLHRASADSSSFGAENATQDDAGTEASDLPEESERFFQVLGVDVLLDSDLQPWLLELNSRPSMDIEETVGEETRVSAVDKYVKQLVLSNAFKLLVGEQYDSYRLINFDNYSPSPVQDALAQISQLYELAGGIRGAFTTRGMRRAMKASADLVGNGFTLMDLDTLVTQWKHHSRVKFRQAEQIFTTGNLKTPDIAMLEFAELIVEIANKRYGIPKRRKEAEAKGDEDDEDDEDDSPTPLDNLTALLDSMDFEE